MPRKPVAAPIEPPAQEATVPVEDRAADRVVMVSYRADGTPDQSDGFVTIGA